ncbi:hypothetical protein NCCP1664_20070 [Zafaria cholistanensis]|uniref:CobW C-terminal domain-containing protein n=1 Tax=Zafaria cholistanensis TaxID=1682741 RepID=A0A5A7NTN3_9MICC|nr:GTP-binding protein [Zafaria cholistanensis]GER23512.1 hypothetical protein NCCP1664_20070 [Zafaria cholistanensis]
MFVTLISSLSARVRDAALEGLRPSFPGAVVLRYDLAGPGTLAAELFRPGRPPQTRMLALEHACLACTAAADAAAVLASLAGGGPEHAVLGLPPGASSVKAQRVLEARAAGEPVAVDSVALAIDPSEVEQVIASPYLLRSAGLLPEGSECIGSGEFVTAALAHADTVLGAEDGVWALLGDSGADHYRAASGRGLELLRELAPHAVVNAPGPVSGLGGFDREAAARRTAPGGVRGGGGGTTFATLELRSDRPLHPGRLHHLLQLLSRSALWTRGQVWLGGCPTLKVVVQGAGPRLRIDASGTWQDRGEAAETVLVLTGEGLDAELLQSSLAACELGDGELAAGIANIELGPFQALARR